MATKRKSWPCWFYFSMLPPISNILPIFELSRKAGFRQSLKYTLRSRFTIAQRLTTAQRFTIATPVHGHHFPWFYRHLSSQRRVHSVVNIGGVGSSLSRSVFSTVGSCGLTPYRSKPFSRVVAVSGPMSREWSECICINGVNE